MAKYSLRLYLTGKTKDSKKAIKDLREILDEKLEEEYDLEVVDIKENPQLAEDEKILATPLVERKLPPPVKRVIGKLSEEEKILLGLDLVAEDGNSESKSGEKKSTSKKKGSKKNPSKEKGPNK